MDRIFRSAGFQLYVVGGAVRNIVLGRKPVDWDLATDAKPEEILPLFRHVIPTGIQHGTVTIRFKGQNYEVTTFRIDGTYSDSRRPDSVEFTPNIYEDLKRRDFTINAMAFDLSSQVIIDPHDGSGDLKQRIIRTVGSPPDRFAEDGLRIIRGIRFAASLQFTIEQRTLSAMKDRIDYLRPVSIERIRDEFLKILQSPRPSLGIELLERVGALPHFLEEVSACRNETQNSLPEGKSLFHHLLAACDHAPENSPELRLAALLHDIGKPLTRARDADGRIMYHGHDRKSAEMAAAICRRLRLPKIVEQKVSHLVAHHMTEWRPDFSDRQIRRLIHRLGRQHIMDLLTLCEADRKAKNGPFYDDSNISESLSAAEPIALFVELRQRFQAMLQSPHPLELGDLDIDGNVLHSLGIPRSKHMKTVLDFLLESVLDDPGLNTQSTLKAIARNFYQERIVPLMDETKSDSTQKSDL